MEAKFQALPPLKRFRLLQQQQQEEQENAPPPPPPPPPPVSSFQLPAKKRKESRVDAAPAPISTYSLPAKKRVWALHPDLILISDSKPLSPLDLNMEYNPKSTTSSDQQPQSPLPSTPCPTNQFFPEEEENKQQIPVVDEEEITNQDESIKEVVEDDDDDDGIVCAICGSTDGDPTDPIVFCDGCDLMVHSTCYGNPLVKGIPDGDWFCNQCLASPTGDSNTSSPSSCCLCPVKGGAMKPTTTPRHGSSSSWAHLVCALFVPEVFFEDPDGRDGIDCSKVPRRRWRGTCFLCERNQGCVLQCSEPTCPLAFHVTCGLKEDLCIEYKQGKKNKETIVAGFCKTHTRLWEKQQGTGKFKIVARDNKCKK